MSETLTEQEQAYPTDPMAGVVGVPFLPLNNQPTAYVASLVVKSGPGVLFGFSGYNSGSNGFLLGFDAGTLPADNAVAVFVMAIVSASNFSANWGTAPSTGGRPFSRGFVLCTSSTAPTKTLGTASVWIDAQYV